MYSTLRPTTPTERRGGGSPQCDDNDAPRPTAGNLEEEEEEEEEEEKERWRDYPEPLSLSLPPIGFPAAFAAYTQSPTPPTLPFA